MKPSPVFVLPTRKKEAFPPFFLLLFLAWWIGALAFGHTGLFLGGGGGGGVAWGAYSTQKQWCSLLPNLVSPMSGGNSHCDTASKEGKLNVFLPKKTARFLFPLFLSPFFCVMCSSKRGEQQQGLEQNARTPVFRISLLWLAGKGKNGAISSHKRKGKKGEGLVGWGCLLHIGGKRGREEDLYQMAWKGMLKWKDQNEAEKQSKYV